MKLLSQFSSFLYSKAKLKTLLIPIGMLVLLFIISALLTPVFSGLESLDELQLYTPTEIYEILDNWGSEGRIAEFWFHAIWDFFLPLSYLLFLGLGISLIYKHAFEPDSKWQKMNLICLVSVFDLLENLLIGIMILAFPSQLIGIAWLKTAFTFIKYIMLIPILIIIGIGLYFLIKKAIAERKAQKL